MKKKESSSHLSTCIEGASVFRDDLDVIVETMRHRSLTITISDNDFVYDSLDEVVAKRGSKPMSLGIHGQGSQEYPDHIEVEFDGNRTWIRGNRNSSCADVYFEFVERIRDRIPRLREFFSPYIWGIAAILICNFDLAMLKAASENDQTLDLSGFHLLLASCSILWLASLFYRRRFLRLNLKRKHEGGFWRRNADQLVLLFIGAIVGALVSAVIVRLLK